MKKRAPIFSLLILPFFIASCTSDDDGNTPQDEMNTNEVDLVILSKQQSVITNPVNEEEANYLEIKKHDFINNKPQNGIREFYVNDVISVTSTYQTVEYDSQNRLTRLVVDEEETLLDYDANGIINEATFILNDDTAGPLFGYVRITEISNTEYYFERLTLPHDDPTTEVSLRNIIIFNEEGNIANAGMDLNMDGITDTNTERTFTYDANDNLISITTPQETLNFAYTNIIDTEEYLSTALHGKKNVLVMQGERYARFPLESLEKFNNSYNVSNYDFETFEYEVAANGYYTKKTKVLDGGDEYNRLLSIEYQFE